MSQQKGRKINDPKGGMVEDLTLRIKLILSLMGDSRVSIFLKVLPVVTLVYLLFPDLLLGPVDDVAIIWLGGGSSSARSSSTQMRCRTLS